MHDALLDELFAVFQKSHGALAPAGVSRYFLFCPCSSPWLLQQFTSASHFYGSCLLEQIFTTNMQTKLKDRNIDLPCDCEIGFRNGDVLPVL